ncbi:MAG: CvpA family protein [Rikenellaceae bacterium]
MNIIDIIIIACIAISIALGIRNGAISQLGSFAGLIISIFAAKEYGAETGALLGITGEYTHVWGFIIILIITLVTVTIITNILSKFVSFVGLGGLDRLAGATLSALKCILILSLVLLLFDIFNKSTKLVDNKYIATSKLYAPTISVSQYILPTIEWVGDQLPETSEKEKK